MTKRERLLIIALVVSFFGFSVFGAVNPVSTGVNKGAVVSTAGNSVSVYRVANLNDDDLDTRYYKGKVDSGIHSKMVEMLSTVLALSPEEVEDALSNGDKPREMLASVGVSLLDLQEEFNFRLVGERGLVKFS